MRVVASPEAARLIREQGGSLYVWPRSTRCCHGFTFLETGAAPEGGRAFRRLETDGFELYLAELGRVPDELHLDVGGRRHKRVEAYWDGCAYVT